MFVGSAEFVSEPVCNRLNGVNITELNSAAWYLNEKTILGESIVLDQTILTENIQVLVSSMIIYFTALILRLIIIVGIFER